MTHDPWSPNSIMKREWLSEKETALKGFLLSLVFYSECSMFFLSSVGMTFILAGYFTTLVDVTPNQCRALTQVLGGLLGPIDYFTNLGGGRDGIFLIIRHSNVMFSLEVTPLR